MKRILAAILAILYMGTSMGANVYTHYCMGKAISISFSEKESKVCDQCGMKKHDAGKKGCCKDEQKQVKTEKVHKAAETNFQYVLSPCTTHEDVSFYYSHVPFITSATIAYPVTNAPPDNSSAPIYILNCIFRI